MWIGGSGGVFAPSLFMGAMLGSAYGAIAHDALPHLAANAGAYGLVGMGAVFASAARAPITAVLIIFELTGDYRVILPLMIAVVIATTVSNAMTSETIYTLKLRRRGINIDAPTPSLMAQITVGEAHGDPPPPLDPDQPLSEILDRFTGERTNALPVIDADGLFLGVVSAGDVEQALANAAGDQNARMLVHETPELQADQTLEDAISRLGTTDDDGLPVLDEHGEHLVGWLTHRQLLRAYRQRIAHDQTSRGPIEHADKVRRRNQRVRGWTPRQWPCRRKRLGLGGQGPRVSRRAQVASRAERGFRCRASRSRVRLASSHRARYRWSGDDCEGEVARDCRGPQRGRGRCCA